MVRYDRSETFPSVCGSGLGFVVGIALLALSYVVRMLVSVAQQFGIHMMDITPA